MGGKGNCWVREIMRVVIGWRGGCWCKPLLVSKREQEQHSLPLVEGWTDQTSSNSLSFPFLSSLSSFISTPIKSLYYGSHSNPSIKSLHSQHSSSTLASLLRGGHGVKRARICDEPLRPCKSTSPTSRYTSSIHRYASKNHQSSIRRTTPTSSYEGGIDPTFSRDRLNDHRPVQ